MTSNYIVSLDLGSSGLRALLIPDEPPWQPLLGAETGYRIFKTGGPDSLAVQFSPKELSRRISSVLKNGVRESGISPSRIIGITITSQRQAIALLRSDGSTMHIGPNRDLRAVFEGQAIDEELGPWIYSLTGHLPSFFFAPAKLHWWKKHHRRIFQKIHRILTLDSWVVHELTGESVGTMSQLNEAGLFSLDAKQPSQFLEKLNLNGSILPTVIGAGTIAGRLKPMVAEDIGLPANIPVFLSGPDTQTGLLGMGLVSSGEFGVISGWNTPVQMVTEQPLFDPQRKSWVGYHLPMNSWISEATAGDTGGVLLTVQRLLGSKFNRNGLDRLAVQSRRGSNMATVFLGPQALDLSNVRVGMGGLLTPIPITSNPIHAGHFVRATLENFAFAIRECIEQLGTLGNYSPTQIGFSGGLAQSQVFPQILSDVLGIPVSQHHHRASNIGSAISASVPSIQWAEAAKLRVSASTLFTPDMTGVIEYNELYSRWLRLKSKLVALEDEL